jgi:hypothetical protein
MKTNYGFHAENLISEKVRADMVLLGNITKK